MAENFIGTEATGIYVGKLVEDMIDTVTREKRLYCNVWIPEFFSKESNYPLTYVPLWAMSLPLKKDDIVLVEFHQDNLMYPVHYKNDSEKEIDAGFYTQFEVNNSVSGGNIEPYQSQKTIGATRLGVDSYLIKTEDYTVIHQNNGFILIDKTDKVYVHGSEINVISDSGVNIDCGGMVNLFSNSTIDVTTNADMNITATAGFTVNNHLQVTQ